MAEGAIELILMDPVLAVCRLSAADAVADWALGGSFSSVTRSGDELSVVCEQERVPPDVLTEAGWRCLMVKGPLKFTAVGILASLTAPLAAAGVSVFVVSTYDTDFLLVKEASLEQALSSLADEGFEISGR